MNELVINNTKIVFTETADGVSTDSLTISNVFNKTHKDMIHNMKKDEAFEEFLGERKITLSSYTSEQNKKLPLYLFDRDAFSYFVMSFTGKEAKRWKLDYIKAFNEMERRLLNPIKDKSNIEDKSAVEKLEDASRILIATKSIAETFGLIGNQALLSANRATKNETGVDLMEKMNIQLIAETKEQILTPTEIGKALKSKKISGIAVNKIIKALGLQEKVGKHWQPTEKGMEFAELLATGKKHSDGTPVKQLKWKQSIVKMINDLD